MFTKLLENLPFNPSLIDEVSFYARRLHQETSIRRLSAVFMVLAMGVQLFAFMAPPEPTLAHSTNDIIFGGIGKRDPKGTMLQIYDSDTDGRNTGIRALFESFNISRQDIAASTLGGVSSNDRSLYSLGRNPHSTLDQPRDIGGQRYYLRPLHTWGSNKTYKALVGTRSNVTGAGEDRYFAIMIDCGNIVIKVHDRPSLTTSKASQSHQENAVVQPGEVIQYRVMFSNVGAGEAHFLQVTDAIPEHSEYVWHGTGGATKHEYVQAPRPPFPGQPAASHVRWDYVRMPGHQQNWYVDLHVRVQDKAPDGTRICNSAYVRAQDAAPQQTQAVCHTVKKAAAPPPAPPATTEVPGQPSISLSKRASNLTRGIQDAHNSTAIASDVISYQLLTVNNGNATSHDYKILEDIDDILEYADVIDISDGGKREGSSIIWKPIDIQPDTTILRTFTVKVKDQIPATPRSSSDPESYDLRMDNVYGNEVRIKLEAPSLAKTTEVVIHTMPNTGPGTALASGFVLTTFVAYFFARSRLMAKELDLVRQEYSSGGI